MLTKEAIFAKKDLKLEKLYIPEWEDYVYVRTLSGTEWDEFEGSTVKGKGRNIAPNLANARAKLAVKVMCDKDGKRLFEDSDAKELGEKHSVAPVQRVFRVAQRLCSMSDEEIEETEKNS